MEPYETRPFTQKAAASFSEADNSTNETPHVSIKTEPKQDEFPMETFDSHASGSQMMRIALPDNSLMHHSTENSQSRVKTERSAVIEADIVPQSQIISMAPPADKYDAAALAGNDSNTAKAFAPAMGSHFHNDTSAIARDAIVGPSFGSVISSRIDITGNETENDHPSMRKKALHRKQTRRAKQNEVTTTASQVQKTDSLKKDLKQWRDKKSELESQLDEHPTSEFLIKQVRDLEKLIIEASTKLRSQLRPATQDVTDTRRHKRRRDDMEKETSSDSDTDTPELARGEKAQDHHQFFKRQRRKRKKVIDNIATILHSKPVVSGQNPSKRRKKSTVVDSPEICQDSGKAAETVMPPVLKAMTCSNPMQARIAHGDLPELKAMNATTKKDAYNQQGENAPETCDPIRKQRDVNDLERASRSFGWEVCTPFNGKWMLKQMKPPLHIHQILGVSWMLSKETSKDRGGILGDEMGLGKTVSTLACIVRNTPRRKDLLDSRRTTLIVVPPTLVAQWMSEIKYKTSRDVIKAYLPFRRAAKIPITTLEQQDIIVTTYDEVRGCYLKPHIQKQVEAKDCTPEKQRDLLAKHCGDLFKMKYHRVILDEAHDIRNDGIQKSIACSALDAKYRWCVTGTPLINDPMELWSYLKFLHLDWCMSKKQFGVLIENYEDPGNAKYLATLVKQIFLGRKMSDTFAGRPFYEIPLCKLEEKWIHLTKEEEVIYSIITNLTNAQGGNPGKKLRQIYLLYCLRLRQATMHPFLLERAIKDTLLSEDILHIQSELTNIGGQTPVFEQIRAESRKLEEESGFGTSTFGHNFDMDSQFAMAATWKDATICNICGNELNEPQEFDCTHIFCKSCIDTLLYQAGQPNAPLAKCVECDKKLEGQRSVSVSKPSPYDEDNNSEVANFIPGPSQKTSPHSDNHDQEAFRMFKKQRELAKASKTSEPRGKDGRRLGDDHLDFQPRTKKSATTFLASCDKIYSKDNPMVPSAKTTAVKETVLEWLSEAPDDKIIIFIEFLEGAQILGRMLQDESMKFIYFTGDMSADKKEAAKEAFADSDLGIKVMIASLKSGGVGLNLVTANRVILVDEWWNHAMQLQAYCRVFRIGQTKETHFLSILAKGTIDEKIFHLQNEKLENIDKCFTSAVRGRGAPKVEEMASLLGLLEEDKDGNTIIEADRQNKDEAGQRHEKQH
ncbi:SNF2 family N-terminal domain-containing protein [Xylariales sp. AK1849]|nr:SNF2 family N-terminal domain-containing protein [Xylariales sp. AK1849]